MNTSLTKLAIRKKAYNARLATYKKRKREVAMVLDFNPRSRVNIGKRSEKEKEIWYRKSLIYRQRTQKLDKKIKVWADAIKRIDIFVERLYVIERAIVAFTDTQIKYTWFTDKNEKYRAARDLFFTFGLENGCSGVSLSEYVGMHSNTAADRRTRFRASFKTKPENRQLWLAFNEYFKDKCVLPEKTQYRRKDGNLKFKSRELQAV